MNCRTQRKPESLFLPILYSQLSRVDTRFVKLAPEDFVFDLVEVVVIITEFMDRAVEKPGEGNPVWDAKKFWLNDNSLILEYQHTGVKACPR